MSFAEDGVAGREYGKLLAELLDDAQKTKASLESRAAGVITTSAALVTLLFGFAAIATRTSQFRPSPTQLAELRFALAAIVAASALGVLVNAPLFYRTVSTTEVARLTEERFWTYADRSEAGRMVARSQVKVLRWARRMNTGKGVLLVAAVLMQVTGVALLAVAVINILTP